MRRIGFFVGGVILFIFAGAILVLAFAKNAEAAMSVLAAVFFFYSAIIAFKQAKNPPSWGKISYVAEKSSRRRFVQ